jgi:photosystem II stability/assembly factor-like uncharacterized protein
MTLLLNKKDVSVYAIAAEWILTACQNTNLRDQNATASFSQTDVAVRKRYRRQQRLWIAVAATFEEAVSMVFINSWMTHSARIGFSRRNTYRWFLRFASAKLRVFGVAVYTSGEKHEKFANCGESRRSTRCDLEFGDFRNRTWRPQQLERPGAIRRRNLGAACRSDIAITTLRLRREWFLPQRRWGASWHAQETGLLEAHPSGGVFAVDALAPGGIWLFDDYGRLYRSTDGGDNWMPTGYVASTIPLLLNGGGLVQGSDGTLWFADTASGLLKSADGGVTFASIGGALSGQSVASVAVSSSNPLVAVAATQGSCGSIYRSTDGGATWISATLPATPSPPYPTCLADTLTSVAFAPTDGTRVYAIDGAPGSYSGWSLLRSDDSGATWTYTAQTGGSFVIAPNDANTIWLDGNKSIDGGISFTPRATGVSTNGVAVPASSALAIHPNYPATPDVWMGTQYAGIYLTNTDGASWSTSDDGLASTNIRALAIHPADHTRLYAGVGDSIESPSPSFYRSTSTGTWEISNSGLGAYQLRTLTFDPTTTAIIGSTVIYGVGSGGFFPNLNGGIYKSADGGLSWSTLDASLPASPYSGGAGHFAGVLRTIIADPRSCDSRSSIDPVCSSGPLMTLYVTGGGIAPGGVHAWRVMKSTDGGVTWLSSETGLPADMFSGGSSIDEVAGVTPIVMDPSDSSVLYIGTFTSAFDAAGDQVTPTVPSGVFKSTDAGANWVRASAGLPTYAGSPQTMYDTLSLAIDPAHPQTLWVSTINDNFNTPGQIYKSTDGATSWTVSNAGVSGPDVRALLVDATNPGTIYAASGGLGPANPGGVYKSTDSGATWASISVGLPAQSALSLVLDPIDSTVLYAGTSGGVYSITQLPDTDADGVPDLIENAGPNGGDANGDGVQDSVQSNVSSTAPGLLGGYGWQAGTANTGRAASTATVSQLLQSLKKQQSPNGIEGGYFTVQIVGGNCTQAVDVAPVNPGPLGPDRVAHRGVYTYPRGLVRFELPMCSDATVDIAFNAATFGAGWSWRYYGPTTPGDNSTMGWHDAQSLVTTQTGNHWRIHLTEGQYGSYRPTGTHSILFEGAPAYDDGIFNDGFE